MKVGDKGSSFQKLSAGTVEGNQKNKLESKPARVDAPAGRGIEQAVRTNVDAASTIARVARDARGSQESRESEVQQRAEVEESVRAASDMKVEDVDRAAELLADRIRNNPTRAEQVHRPDVTKVQQLLQ